MFRRSVTSPFLFALILLASSLIFADDEPGSHARVVRVSSVNGDVQLAHQQAAFRNVIMSSPVVQGDVVRTGNDGWVEFQLETGSRIRLAPDSKITFAVLSRFASGATATEVNLNEGEAAFAVVAGDDYGPFRVNVHDRVINLKRSTRFRVTSIPSDPLEVVVWKGEVSIFDRESTQEVNVAMRQTFTLNGQDQDHYDLQKDAQVDELDDWANQRDQALMAYADTRTVPNLSYDPAAVSPVCYSCNLPSTLGTAYSTAPYYDPTALAFASPYPYYFFNPFFQPGFFGPVFIIPPSLARPRPLGIHPPVVAAGVRAAVIGPPVVGAKGRLLRIHPVVEMPTILSRPSALIGPAGVAGRTGPGVTSRPAAGVTPHPPVSVPHAAPAAHAGGRR